MVKIALLLAITFFSINASNLVTIYKNEGIKSVEKKLDLALTSKTYWEKELKNIDTKFGYYESANTVLVCDKSKGTLKFYTKNGNKFDLRKSHSAFTGKESGDKFEEGDSKTPVGVYSIKNKIISLDQFYGPLAFSTSYPNLYDRVRGKNGHGIWIHGRPLNDEQRESYTKGCIAIENANIECMGDNLDVKNTVLIIDEVVHVEDKKSSFVTILAQLYKWRYDWIYNNFNSYISFYAKDFRKSNGDDLESFSSYKKRVFSYNDKKTILFNNIRITPYPGDVENLFVISLDEEYNSKRLIFSGKKTLMVYLDSESKMRIIAED
ncbi:MAG: L,D-transpeptidase family protein [Campylobacterota bacterium]|nr:L,D-transpeptidase family protein [Campylobacterota bacterium]